MDDQLLAAARSTPALTHPGRGLPPFRAVPQGPRAHEYLEVYTRQELHDRGITRSQLGRRLENGRLRQLGRNRYGTANTPDEVVRALRADARLTCVSSLTLHGFWEISHRDLHVARYRQGTHAGGRSPRPGMLLHDPALQEWPDDSVLLPPLVALRHAVHCMGVEDTAMLIESGLRRGLLTTRSVEILLENVSLRTQRALGDLHSDADSGTETRVRRFFEKMRVDVRSQVEFFDGRWRVDLLVGEVLVIECDSVAFHTGVENHARTYRKRLDLHSIGLLVVNLTYAQVMYDWQTTQDTLRLLIREGRHRAPRRGNR